MAETQAFTSRLGRFCGAAFAAAALPAAAVAAQTIELTQAISHALQQNRSLVLSAYDRQSATVNLSSAEADFQVSVRPEVSLNTSDDGNDATTLGMSVSRRLRTGTELSARLASEDFSADDGRIERLQIELQQPLFRFGGRLVNEESIVFAGNALRSARRRYEQQKIDLILDVVRSYENILRLERQLLADEKSLQRAEVLSRSTRAKEALGRSTRIDSLRVELQRGQALSRLETDRERLYSAQQSFAELLGFDPDTEFQLKPTKLLEVDIPAPKEVARIAFDNRLDYAQSLQDYQDAARGVRIARKQLLPDLRVVARYERRSDAANDGFDLDDDNYFLGLAADTDFNQVRERSAVQQAQIGEASADQIIRVLELSIARDAQQRVLAYRRAHAELKILERNLKHAGARLDLARRLFDIGRGDNFSVTDAEEAFLQAESDLFTGRADASITAYELLRAMGTLTDPPGELKPQVF